VSLELGVTGLKGIGGLRSEELFRITAGGCESLTPYACDF